MGKKILIIIMILFTHISSILLAQLSNTERRMYRDGEWVTVCKSNQAQVDKANKIYQSMNAEKGTLCADLDDQCNLIFMFNLNNNKRACGAVSKEGKLNSLFFINQEEQYTDQEQIMLPAEESSEKLMTSHGIPLLKPNHLWISSIPLQAQVFVFSEENSPKHSHRIDKPGPMFPTIDITNFPDLVTATTNTYFKGNTPCIVTINPGIYYVYIVKSSKDEIFGLEANWNGYISVQNGEELSLVKRAMVYKIEKKADTPATLIALFYPQKAAPPEIESLYPQTTNFVFNDRNMQSILGEQGIAEDKMERYLQQLHRGGKILISTSGNWFSLELAPDFILKRNAH